MSQAEEVELKLELTPEAADMLERAGLFAGKRKIVRQHAIYFDTPDHALSAAGFSLRIHRNGKKRVQTINAGGGSAAGLFSRPEWERDVKMTSPFWTRRRRSWNSWATRSPTSGRC